VIFSKLRWPFERFPSSPKASAIACTCRTKSTRSPYVVMVMPMAPLCVVFAVFRGQARSPIRHTTCNTPGDPISYWPLATVGFWRAPTGPIQNAAILAFNLAKYLSDLLLHAPPHHHRHIWQSSRCSGRCITAAVESFTTPLDVGIVRRLPMPVQASMC
jgi:hypothetical protein